MKAFRESDFKGPGHCQHGCPYNDGPCPECASDIEALKQGIPYGSAQSLHKKASAKTAKFQCQECGKILPESARKCSRCGSDDLDLFVGKQAAISAVIKEVTMQHTAKNVEAQVKSAAPELTKLAKHRVALAYAMACSNKTASTTTARRRMVEAFLTMPTFALQSLYDMHSASSHTAGPDDLPPPEEEAAPAPEGDIAPEGADMPLEGGDDLGMEGGDLGGGMDLGLGGGMGGGAEMAPAEDTGLAALKSENEALVGDIQQLEQDFARLQETLPEGGALDLSSILSEEAMDEKAEQLPEGGEGEDPALNFMPEGDDSGEHKSASIAAEDVDDGSFERDLLGSLQGVDCADQASDPALPEEVDPLLNQVDIDEPDYADIPYDILGALAPAAGAPSNVSAAPKMAGTSKVASAPKTAGARFVPSGAMAPASQDDQQVTRLASLLKDFS